MQKQLIFRVKALEQRLPDEAGATKTVIPEWLVEELGKQKFQTRHHSTEFGLQKTSHSTNLVLLCKILGCYQKIVMMVRICGP